MRSFREHYKNPHPPTIGILPGIVKTFRVETNSLTVAIEIDSDGLIKKFHYQQSGVVSPWLELSFLVEYLPQKPMNLIKGYSSVWMKEVWGVDYVEHAPPAMAWNPLQGLFLAIWQEYQGQSLLSNYPAPPLACRCFHFSVADLKKLVLDQKSASLVKLQEIKPFALGCRTCSPTIQRLLQEYQKLIPQAQSHMVCKCFKVTQEELQDILTQYPQITLTGFRSSTKAGTGCGSCQHEVEKIYSTFQLKKVRRIYKNRSHADWMLDIDQTINFLWKYPPFNLYPKPRVHSFNQGTVRLEMPKLTGDQEWEFSHKMLNQLRTDLDGELKLELIWI